MFGGGTSKGTPLGDGATEEKEEEKHILHLTFQAGCHKISGWSFLCVALYGTDQSRISTRGVGGVTWLCTVRKSFYLIFYSSPILSRKGRGGGEGGVDKRPRITCNQILKQLAQRTRKPASPLSFWT